MTETHPSPFTERHHPPRVAAEREMLDAWLDFHRATLLLKCEGLTDEQLKTRSVEPSSLSLLGLVRHMTEVERGWFRRVLVAEDAKPLYYAPGNDDGDFDDVESADVAADLARFREEVEHCRRVAAEHPDLDSVGKALRHGREFSLRWIYVHMIEEYARHNGHADFLRERIDGRTGQ
jgi:hypothetical protein